jgi:hypothetical protein
MLAKWVNHYRGSFYGKMFFQRVRKLTPKFICWQIWLAKNRSTFKDQNMNPGVVASHDQGQLAKLFNSKRIRIAVPQMRSHDEERWMAMINVICSIRDKLLLRSD